MRVTNSRRFDVIIHGATGFTGRLAARELNAMAELNLRWAISGRNIGRLKEMSADLGCDHLDCGSVASPNRETEAMKDGSDAIADWPLLNGMFAVASGASWVSIHHGGGVGIGYSQHSGQVICCDGTFETDKRIEALLTNDPGMGVVRHVDAGYDEAIDCMNKYGVNVPR